MVVLPSSRAQAFPRGDRGVCPGRGLGVRRWPLGCGGARRAADPNPRPRSSVRRRQAAALAHAPNHRKARKREPGAGPGLSACPVPASLPYQDPFTEERASSPRYSRNRVRYSNPKMVSARLCRLWRELIGALTSTRASAWITEIKRTLQRISRDRTRALLVLPCETQITNEFENRSSKPRRNDYVPVSGVNTEYLRLTAGGCCLLSSKRSIAGTLPVKTSIYSA